jgi:hypothetical protein
VRGRKVTVAQLGGSRLRRHRGWGSKAPVASGVGEQGGCRPAPVGENEESEEQSEHDERVRCLGACRDSLKGFCAK